MILLFWSINIVKWNDKKVFFNAEETDLSSFLLLSQSEIGILDI